jgi:hypothetical protein
LTTRKSEVAKAGINKNSLKLTATGKRFRIAGNDVDAGLEGAVP